MTAAENVDLIIVLMGFGRDCQMFEKRIPASVSMQELTGSERSISERYINVLMAAAVFTLSVLATDVSPENDDEEVKTTQTGWKPRGRERREH